MLRLAVISIITFLLGVVVGERLNFNPPAQPLAPAAVGNAGTPASEPTRNGTPDAANRPASERSTNVESSASPQLDPIDETWQSLIALARPQSADQRFPDNGSSEVDALLRRGVDLESAEWAVGLWGRLQQALSGGLAATEIDLYRLQTELQREIRERLDDTNYEAFLEVMGLPTAIPVPGIVASSAAAVAGLQPGDQILRYNNKRVFSTAELLDESRSGSAGQPVTIEILRAGVPYTLTITRGELGVSRGGSSQLPVF